MVMVMMISRVRISGLCLNLLVRGVISNLLIVIFVSEVLNIVLSDCGFSDYLVFRIGVI